MRQRYDSIHAPPPSLSVGDWDWLELYDGYSLPHSLAPLLPCSLTPSLPHSLTPCCRPISVQAFSGSTLTPSSESSAPPHTSSTCRPQVVCIRYSRSSTSSLTYRPTSRSLPRRSQRSSRNVEHGVVAVNIWSVSTTLDTTSGCRKALSPTQPCSIDPDAGFSKRFWVGPYLHRTSPRTSIVHVAPHSYPFSFVVSSLRRVSVTCGCLLARDIRHDLTRVPTCSRRLADS